ncbi:major facilitator superfamily domain-containing protein [Mycena latifolia]|nr:major facilitator superfamily domain-containing protein [Mycena latifolia]
MASPTSDEKVDTDLGFLKASNASSASLDKAILYVQQTEVEADATDVEAATLLRKIDRRIIPLACAAYMLQFLDKLDINYAAVMGLNKDLGLVGNNFNNAASAMYIASLVAELPTAYIVQKVPPGRWLGLNIILWGLVTACSAGVKDYNGLLASRVLVGIFEAATPPCLMLITGLLLSSLGIYRHDRILGIWYTKPEAIFRFGIWYTGLGFAQMIGSLCSWGFLQVTHETLAGWRIMFIVLGCLTMVMGAWTFFTMPNSPMDAEWLTEVEKRQAIQRVAVNQTGIKNTHFKLAHLRELALDVQMWIIVAMTALLSMGSGVVSFYSTTLIRNFGFSPERSALLNMPSGAVALISSVVVGYCVQKQGNRTTWIPILSLVAALGSALMSFLPASQKGGLLVGIYLINIATPALVLFFSLVTANVAGQTKRVAANAIVTAAFCIGNIVGPQLFKPKDAPQYIPAKIVLLVSQLVSAVLAIILRVYYGWQNSRKDAVEGREREAGEAKEIPNIEWLNLTDKENKTFRYKY